MKRIRLFSAALTMAMLFASSAVFAQLKVGTNPTTIGANSNLEVEASTAGRKVIVDKTSGQVTIADGTQAAGKVLTSDANGAASWQSPGASNGYEILRVQINSASIPGTGGTFSFLAGAADFNTIPGASIGNNYIQLPAGRYRITAMITAAISITDANNYIQMDLWVSGTYYQGLDWQSSPYGHVISALTGSAVVQMNAPGGIQIWQFANMTTGATLDVTGTGALGGARSYIIVEKMQ